MTNAAAPGARFTLRVGRWYAWEMLPGYVDDGEFDPYLSPIYISSVLPLRTGESLLKVNFINAAYTEGVQEMEAIVRVLLRSTAYMLSELNAARE